MSHQDSQDDSGANITGSLQIEEGIARTFPPIALKSLNFNEGKAELNRLYQDVIKAENKYVCGFCNKEICAAKTKRPHLILQHFYSDMKVKGKIVKKCNAKFY